MSAALGACGSQVERPPISAAASSPTVSVESTAQPDTCHLKARQPMIAALERDGDLDALPKTPDRSLGIPACKGLTTDQLDALALQLQDELAPYILDAAAKHASPSA